MLLSKSISIGLLLAQPEVPQDVASKQEVEFYYPIVNAADDTKQLSGMCTRLCMQAINDGNDAVFGKDAEQLTSGEVDTLGGTSWKARKPTAAEEERGFKLVFEAV